MPRSLWTGAISFGLVNIPVKMFRATATQSARSVGFHQLHDQCGTRLQHKRWCPKEDVEVPWEHVVKGYEVSKGRYVEITDEDLDQLLPEDDYAAIAIESFVALDEVDPLYYDRAYYLSPDGSAKAYALLFDALQDAGRVAIARVTLRTRQHLAIVRAQATHLVLSTMFFEDEIVDPAQVPGVPSGKVDEKQLQMAEQLIESMTTPFEPARFKDEYTEKVKEVIEAKIKEGEVTESVALPSERAGGEVVSLMDALKRSIAEHKGGELPSIEKGPRVKRARRASPARARRGSAGRHAAASSTPSRRR
jgi:DNA end-binding protein Ku